MFPIALSPFWHTVLVAGVIALALSRWNRRAIGFTARIADVLTIVGFVFAVSTPTIPENSKRRDTDETQSVPTVNGTPVQKEVPQESPPSLIAEAQAAPVPEAQAVPVPLPDIKLTTAQTRKSRETIDSSRKRQPFVMAQKGYKDGRRPPRSPPSVPRCIPRTEEQTEPLILGWIPIVGTALELVTSIPVALTKVILCPRA